MHLPAGGEYYCFSGFDRKTFRTSSLFTITYNFSPRATLSFYGAGCCLSLAQSATVKIKNIVATADMRRHSDTLRGANATTKEEVNGGENTRTSFLRSEGVVVPVKSELLHFSLLLITFSPEEKTHEQALCAASVLYRPSYPHTGSLVFLWFFHH